MTNKKRGLFRKFNVSRIDGSDVSGEKHDGCEYFVLDLTHDPFAHAALLAYADRASEAGYTKLSEDLYNRAEEIPYE